MPVDRMVEKEERAVRFMNPFVVSITKNWSSAKSLTGSTDVILSPGGTGRICQSAKTSGISNTFEDPRYEDIMSTDPYEYLKCLTHLQKYRIIQKSKPADIEDSGAT